jgi:hypothetical protein
MGQVRELEKAVKSEEARVVWETDKVQYRV